ncbi:MAG: AAA family ATPase [Bacteroidetes bacterium]|nr:AAA family ATPase [Bacteroidota bacterium]
MIGRQEQIQAMQDALTLKASSFIAVTGRRRVGKTYLIRQIYQKNICFSVTGIQHANLQAQINNVVQKIEEQASHKLLIGKITGWQDVFTLLKRYLQTLPKTKKQVLFIDELPWMVTAKSNFLQLLAHLWNDYLSQEKHFILVVCGSATSWITQKIINDKGGFHNRVTIPIHLKPFTLAETRQFLESKSINYTSTGIAQVYMTIGGLPYYLEQLKRSESPVKAIERLCFSDTGVLKYEYNNLYKALFTGHENHEAIVEALAMAHGGLTREELIKKSKVAAGGPFTRAINDLIVSDFVIETIPFGKIKRGMVYRLLDEFSVFYHRFMKGNEKKESSIWPIIANSQRYKIWQGFAFETLCMKHVTEIKSILGIKNVYSETAHFASKGTKNKPGFQIDLLIDRKDAAINLCECKFYEDHFEITKSYAQHIKHRTAEFRKTSGTKKMLINTFITNEQLIENEYSNEVVDNSITVEQMMA